MVRAHHRPRTVLATLTILMVLSVVAATGLRIDTDSSRMLSPDLPAQRAAHELNEKFPSLKSSIIVTVSARHADATDLVVRALARDLRGRTATIGRVFAPAEDPYLAANGFLYRDLDDLERVFTRLNKSANLLAHLRADQSLDGFTRALDEAVVLAERAEISADALERLFAETASVIEAQTLGRPRPFAWNTVLEDETPGHVTRLIAVTPLLDTSRLSPAKPALREIRAAIAGLPASLRESVEIGITGEPALRAEELRSVTATIGISLALSLVLVGLLLFAGLRSGARVVLALGVLVCSLVLTTGFAALAVGSLNLISIAFIVLMVGLGIDFAIHILAHIAELRAHGSAPADAIRLTAERTGLALGLSALTTALAFLAFAMTDFIGMAQLGVIGAGGALIAFIVAATMIPAVIALRPRLADGALGRPVIRYRRIPRAAQRIGAAMVLALGCAAIWPATQARFEADPMALRDPASGSVVTFRMLAGDVDTTPYRASVLVQSANEANRIAARFRDKPGIGEAIDIGDLVPDGQEAKLMLLDLAAPSIDHAVAGQPTALLADEGAGGNRLDALTKRLAPIDGMARRLHRALTAYRKIRTQASDRELTGRIFHSFGLLTGRLEAMLGADTVTATTLPAALRERFLSPDGTYRVEILPDGDLGDPEVAHRFAATVRDIAPGATGGPVQLAAAGRTVASAMLMATLIAAAVTGLLSLGATGRLADAAAILVPLVVAGLITTAFSTLAGVPFNYANVIVLPLMIGIGVDSGIHIALRERRAPGAVFATSTPGAVVLAALTTIAAFGTLALSDHRGTASMGILLGVAILVTVISVLVLTPQLIRWARNVGF